MVAHNDDPNTEDGATQSNATPSHLTTLNLVHEARGGSDDAMTRLYQKLLPFAKRWAHGRLPKAARRIIDTEDMVQDTLAATLSRIKSFDPRGGHAIYAYLRQALRNRLHDEMRKIVRHPAIDITLPENIALNEPSPLEQAAGKQTLERYEAVLQSLTDTERAMVVGRIEFGLSWKEVAEVTGKPTVNAARMAVGRILVRIAKQMGAKN